MAGFLSFFPSTVAGGWAYKEAAGKPGGGVALELENTGGHKGRVPLNPQSYVSLRRDDSGKWTMENTGVVTAL